MSIDRVNIGNASLDPSYAIQDKEQTRTGQQNERVSSGQDSVNLSPAAQEIDRVTNKVLQTRDERLDQIRKSIDSGTYHVSSEQIAKMLIELNRR